MKKLMKDYKLIIIVTGNIFYLLIVWRNVVAEVGGRVIGFVEVGASDKREKALIRLPQK